MARKTKLDTEIIQFGNEDTDTLSSIRHASIASDLYLIDNPYMGNKRKIVQDIADSLEKHKFNFSTMIDVFSGSGMVSLFFKLLGKTVIANDLLTSSSYNTLAFVENSDFFLIPPEIEYLCKNDNPDKNDFVRANYSERFAPKEALFLDNFRANVKYMDRLYTSDYQVKIGQACAIVLIEHYIMQHCFLGGRLNNGQILAKLEHRLQHDRNFRTSAAEELEMSFKLPLLPHFSGPKGLSLNLDCLDALKRVLTPNWAYPAVDLAYIDPPYGGQQSDYATMFAFCEEFIYSDKLENLPHLVNSRKFSSVKEYKTHFQDVLYAANSIPQWAISYNDSSWADIDTIKNVVSDFKKEVIVINIDYHYNYRKLESSATEYLILAR